MRILNTQRLTTCKLMKKEQASIFVETIIIALTLLFLGYVFSVLSKYFQITSVFVTVFFQAFFVLFCLSLIYKETKTLKLRFLSERLRLKKITIRTLYRAFGVFLIANILVLFSGLSLKFFGVSDGSSISDGGMKTHIQGGSHRIALSFLAVIWGPLIEEIFFRGYLLPRQERVLGKYAWILNGLTFGVVHMMSYKVYSLLLMVPVFFLISYEVQKYKDTSLGLLVHMLLNIASLIKILV